MHRTLKADTAKPPKANMIAQQLAFDVTHVLSESCNPCPRLHRDGEDKKRRNVPMRREVPLGAW
jgi:hypothetical protein